MTTSVQQLLPEGLISLSAAGRYIASQGDGNAIHPATFSRWIGRGLVRPDGSRVRLEAVRVGGRWMTSKAAIARFLEAQQHANEDSAADAVRSPSAFAAEAEAAGRELERLGA